MRPFARDVIIKVLAKCGPRELDEIAKLVSEELRRRLGEIRKTA